MGSRHHESKRKKVSQEDPLSVPIQNRFGALQDLDDSSSSMEENVPTKNINSNSKEEKKYKLPPICITEKIMSYSRCISAITNACKSDKTQIVYSGKEIKVFTQTLEDYEALLTALRSDNMAYFTYCPKWVKPKHVIIKGLPNLSKEEITDDLKNKNVDIKKIDILKNKNGNVSLNPIFKLTLSPKVDLKKIWEIDHICRVKIHWEKYKNSKSVTQCHRCQDFGHGTLFCLNKPRCVKCD